MRITWIVVCFALALASAAPSSVESVKAKFHGLALAVYPPGSRVTMRMRDLNPYLESIIPYNIPNGLRNVHVETDSDNIVRGTADIDFLKVHQAQGIKPNWLLSQLVGGERPVAITVRLTSAHGKARVDVLKVAISGVVAEGRTLDFLITNFVIPNFPEAKIGTDFELGYHIDRFEIQPGQVVVALRDRHSWSGDR